MTLSIKKGILLFLIFVFFSVAFLAIAQDLEIEYPTVPGAPLSGEPTLPEYIRYLYNFSIIIAGLVALFSFAYGGLRYMFSVGSPAAMADARDQITAGMVGLIILLGSYLFLVAVNPQLVIFRLNPQELPPLEMPEPIPIELTAQVYDVYEIPIGQLIENALEPGRLAMISGIANRISNDSGVLRNKAVEFWDLLNQCSCDNTDPSFSCVASGLGEVCPIPLPPPAAQCVNDPCPDRASIIAAKNDLPGLADNLATTMETMLPPLTSLKKDEQRLEIGAEILKETIYPINYDNLLEIKQLIMEIGGEIRIIPFIVLGQRIPGRGDPSTFYTDEERVAELIASDGFPAFPRFDTLVTCNECQIDIRFADFDISDAKKAELAAEHPNGKITDPCPGGIDCWDYVINWAKSNGWNPAFLLALWGEETGFSRAGAALGCIYYPTGETAPGDIVSQLDCFEAHDGVYQGYCQTGNTEFCGFMRYWSGGASCTLSYNPNFWPNLFPLYERLIPSEIDPVDNPAAPSGNCTTTAPGVLPPELAGCPLDPTEPSFGITCGWEGYAGHRGIDINAADGDPVYAIADGTIFATGSDAEGCGIQIWLDTGGYGVFRYCHLLNTIIPLGTNIGVLKGDLIGLADTTGTSITGSHLHFEYRPDGITPYPVECLGTECISTAPDLSSGICTNGPVGCP